ncbi:MAG: sugar phosphate isomerase/epimerase [Candidatus Bathyarchaeota archaeon]|nr:sugar phosphate isomerase/epimerase [Candidatus Bathyarchaeota archaeon]
MDNFVENLISVSSAPIAKLVGKKYYDLDGTLKVMKKVFRESVVDGFELQLQPEWDSENPPLTDTQFADWTKTPKYTVDDILRIFKKQSLPILSVHASRDIGSYLCSSRKQDNEKGRQLIHDSLYLANDLGAHVCVFHLWDTWKTKINWQKLKKDLLDMIHPFAKVKASVENIPTHVKGYTPFLLVKHFDHITLDVKWSSLYNELDRFESIVDKIANVHMRGRLRGDRWFLNSSSFGFYEVLDLIRKRWKYPGLLTIEPEGERNISLFNSFVKAMKSLRTQSD